MQLREESGECTYRQVFAPQRLILQIKYREDGRKHVYPGLFAVAANKKANVSSVLSDTCSFPSAQKFEENFQISSLVVRLTKRYRSMHSECKGRRKGFCDPSLKNRQCAMSSPCTCRPTADSQSVFRPKARNLPRSQISNRQCALAILTAIAVCKNTYFCNRDSHQ